MKFSVYFLVVFISVFFIVACNNTNSNLSLLQNQQDEQLIDSLKKVSDTFYVKRYGRTDFVTAEYIIVKKDSIHVQVMRDSANKLRQLVVTKKNINVYVARFFKNGQLMAKTTCNVKGNIDGIATNYYDNGSVKEHGNYTNGIKTGKWKEYSVENKLTETVFDTNGIKIR
ncbi:MAG: hypothetical protein H7320_08755 [Ferruginibacter sp.]|nr:hypothetical protein [Ferruginibacter sp.]